MTEMEQYIRPLFQINIGPTKRRFWEADVN